VDRGRGRLTAAAGAVAAVAGLVLVAGCQMPTGSAATGPAPASSVEAQLAELVVRAEDTGAHYRRAEWGGWANHNGCDTRELVLREQGHGVVAGKGCTPVCPAGTPPCWVSSYDGVATADSKQVQVDHRVPVKEAVRSGARNWDQAQRERFYNDTNNLVAVSVHANESKGDGDPGVWRPSKRDSWCGYATGYIATKRAYQLTVDQREHDALVAMVRTCGGAA
jgi:hypothetical protein